MNTTTIIVGLITLGGSSIALVVAVIMLARDCINSHGAVVDVNGKLNAAQTAIAELRVELVTIRAQYDSAQRTLATKQTETDSYKKALTRLEVNHAELLKSLSNMDAATATARINDELRMLQEMSRVPTNPTTPGGRG
jgi:septal ring factor EnvC (AmiA/AmiB activator)